MGRRYVFEFPIEGSFIDFPTGEGLETRLAVEVDYSPGRPGKMYLANGDPGYPDEAPEVSTTSMTLFFERRFAKTLGTQPILTLDLDRFFEDLGLSTEAREAFDEYIQNKVWDRMSEFSPEDDGPDYSPDDEPF